MENILSQYTALWVGTQILIKFYSKQQLFTIHFTIGPLYLGRYCQKIYYIRICDTVCMQIYTIN